MNGIMIVRYNMFDIVMEYTYNLLPAIVVVTGRPVHRIVSIVSLCLKYKIYTHVLCLRQSPVFTSRSAYW